MIDIVGLFYTGFWLAIGIFLYIMTMAIWDKDPLIFIRSHLTSSRKIPSAEECATQLKEATEKIKSIPKR